MKVITSRDKVTGIYQLEDGRVQARVKTRKAIMTWTVDQADCRVYRVGHQLILTGFRDGAQVLLIIGGPRGGHSYDAYYRAEASNMLLNNREHLTADNLVWPVPPRVPNPRVAGKVKPYNRPDES